VKQPKGFRSLHLRDRIFPDADLAVEDESFSLKRADHFASKVDQSDIAMPFFA
jgi:hypothetical protein